MLTNIPLLFILILIITFSLSQEDETACTKQKPTSRNDCFAISVPNGYCCYNKTEIEKGTETEAKTEVNCQFIAKDKLKENNDIDCGITDEYYGKYEFGQYHPEQELDNLGFETCGKYKPSKKEDCTDYSEISNSCCLFSLDGKKSCLHIGRKYVGDFKKKSFTIDNNKQVEYECKSFNLILNLYSILLIILFL